MATTEDDKYPLVSCIMLAGRHPIQDVLASIECFKKQTYPYRELIIVNNVKTNFDASALNIQAERNVAIIDTPMEYAAGMARNYGIATSNGGILAQFDADFWYAPTRLEAQIATIAQNNANVVVLASTLQYSVISGRASYHTNDRNAILNTMVCVRPRNLDYPNIDKQEELGFLEKFQQSGGKLIAMSVPELACKLRLSSVQTTVKTTNCGLTKEHYAVVKKMIKARHTQRE